MTPGALIDGALDQLLYSSLLCTAVLVITTLLGSHTFIKQVL